MFAYRRATRARSAKPAVVEGGGRRTASSGKKNQKTLMASGAGAARQLEIEFQAFRSKHDCNDERVRRPCSASNNGQAVGTPHIAVRAGDICPVFVTAYVFVRHYVKVD